MAKYIYLHEISFISYFQQIHTVLVNMYIYGGKPKSNKIVRLSCLKYFIAHKYPSLRTSKHEVLSQIYKNKKQVHGPVFDKNITTHTAWGHLCPSWTS